MRPSDLAGVACRLLGLAALSLVSATASAVVAIPSVPGYGVFYGTGIDGLDSKSALTLGSLTSENTFGSATATVGTAPSPFVSLNLTSSDSSLGAHDAQAFAQMEYWVAVTGVSGTEVPVWLSASGLITHSDDNVNISAQLKVLNNTTTEVLLAKDLCYHSLTCGTTGTDSFSVSNMPITMKVGHLYYVSFVTQAVAMTNGSGSGNATVFLDPTFMIDPNFANASQHSLVFSEGIAPAPVPEPATWAMLGAGLVLVGAGRFRARRSA